MIVDEGSSDDKTVENLVTMKLRKERRGKMLFK